MGVGVWLLPPVFQLIGWRQIIRSWESSPLRTPAVTRPRPISAVNEIPSAGGRELPVRLSGREVSTMPTFTQTREFWELIRSYTAIFHPRGEGLSLHSSKSAVNFTEVLKDLGGRPPRTSPITASEKINNLRN